MAAILSRLHSRVPNRFDILERGLIDRIKKNTQRVQTSKDPLFVRIKSECLPHLA